MLLNSNLEIVDICVCVRLGRNNGGIAVRVGKEDNWGKTNERYYVTLADSMRGGALGASGYQIAL